jgi:adenylate cyclase
VADIFVSYSRADKERVAPLVKALEAQGWSIWWDPQIAPGAEFDDLISRELEQARALVVVWTPNSVDSRWVRGEARDAADRGILVPVRFDNARLPIDFRALHTTDVDAWKDDPGNAAFVALRKALESMLGPPKQAAAQTGKSGRAQVSVCVLPFANMSGDPEQDYFADGVTEDIITDLSKISALSIVSRNTAFSFKGKQADVAQVARHTKASHVLEGSVRKAGNRVRITAQLIYAADDSHVWAERYDRDLSDIFALQDEISKAVVAALRLTLLPEEKRAIEQRSTNNAEAYKLYLMARQFVIMGTERHNELIVRICRRAVELDLNYARAWATMAVAQRELHSFRGDEEDGQQAAERAIALDPDLADAHAALGGAYYARGRFEEGLAACGKALALEADSYEAHRVAGLCCVGLRRFDDAIRHFEAAAAAVETEFHAAVLVLMCYEAKNDVHRIRETAQRALARIEKVIAVAPDHDRALAVGVVALASLGERDRAKEWVARGMLLNPGNLNQHYNFACAMSRLHETDLAVELLEHVADKASEGLIRYIDSDPDFDPIREDARFLALMARAHARLSGGEPKAARA